MVGKTFSEMVYEAMEYRKNVFEKMEEIGPRKFNDIPFKEEEIPKGPGRQLKQAHFTRFKTLIRERREWKKEANQHLMDLHKMDENNPEAGPKIERILDLYNLAEENLCKNQELGTLHALHQMIKRMIKRIPKTETEKIQELQDVADYLEHSHKRHEYLYDLRPEMRRQLGELAKMTGHEIPEHKLVRHSFKPLE